MPAGEHWKAKRAELGISEEKPCEKCGAIMRYSEVRQPGSWAIRRFCSLICRDAAMRAGEVFKSGEASPLWKAGHELKNPRARAQRLYGLEGQECEACGEPAILRHHWDEDVEHNDPSNIALLCRPCHSTLHKKRLRRKVWSERKREWMRRHLPGEVESRG